MIIKILYDGVSIGGFEVSLSKGLKNIGTVGKALGGVLLFSSPTVSSAFCLSSPCPTPHPFIKYLSDKATKNVYKLDIEPVYSDYVPILSDKICGLTVMPDQPNVTWSYERQTCASVITTTINADTTILDCLDNCWQIICNANSNTFTNGILVGAVPAALVVTAFASVCFLVYRDCARKPDQTVTIETRAGDEANAPLVTQFSGVFPDNNPPSKSTNSQSIFGGGIQSFGSIQATNLGNR